MKLKVWYWAIVLVLVLVPTSAHAYVDPGMTGFLVTSLLGAMAAVGYVVRQYLARIKLWITRKPPVEETQDLDEKS